MSPINTPEPAEGLGAAEPTGRRGWLLGWRGGSGRLGPRAYRVLRAAHILVSGGWLGVGIGKLVLEFSALSADSPRRAEMLFTAATAIGTVFPPLIVATLLTGAVLSLGTRWGLLRYYWVLTKLGLTLAVVATALCLIDRLAWQALGVGRGGPDTATDTGSPGVGHPVGLLTWLSAMYTAMLLVAVVVSVYKPWGRISWHGRPRRPRPKTPPP